MNLKNEFVIVGDIKPIPKDVKVFATYKNDDFKDRYLFTGKIEERSYYEPFGKEDYILIDNFYAPITIYEGKFETAYVDNFNGFETEVEKK